MSSWLASSFYINLDKSLISSIRDTDLNMLLNLFKQYKVENFARLYEKVQSTLEIYHDTKKELNKTKDELSFLKDERYAEGCREDFM